MRIILSLCVLLSACQHDVPTFVVTNGNDTIAIEKFKRIANRLEGELSGPAVAAVKYSVDFDRNGWPTAMAIETNGRTTTQRFKPDLYAHPYINSSYALLEPVIMEARKRSSVPANARMFSASGGQPIPAKIDFFTRRGYAIVQLDGGELHLEIDAEGRILSGTVPSQNLTITRVERTRGVE